MVYSGLDVEAGFEGFDQVLVLMSELWAGLKEPNVQIFHELNDSEARLEIRGPKKNPFALGCHGNQSNV